MSSPWTAVLRRYARMRERRAIWFLALLSILFLALSIVVRWPQLLHLDTAITAAVQSLRSEGLDRVAFFLSWLGNGETLAWMVPASAAILVFADKRRAALLTLVTLLGFPHNMAIKSFIGRPRPTEGVVELLLPAVGLSYPSGHAMMALLFYGLLATLAWVHITTPRLRIGATVFLGALSLAVGLSRVYVGVHWLSDVIGGWFAGTLCLLLLVDVYKWIAPDELPTTDVRKVR